MNDFLQQLVSMGPGIGAAVSGNGDAFASFMAGWNRAQQRAEQQQRLKQQDAVAMEDRALRLEDRERGIARQTEADAVAAQTRQQQQALQGMQIPGHLAEMGAAGETPEDAQRIIESAMPNLMKAFGQESMAYGQPAVEMAQRTITGRQKKQVEQFVDAALKTAHVADNPDADPEIQLPEHIQRVVGKPSARLSELQSFAQLPIGKPAGKTRTPAAAGSMEEFSDPATPPERKAQILEDRKAYMQSDDRAPRVTVNTGGGVHPPAVQRRVDAIVRGFDSQPIVKKTQTMAEAVSFAEGLDANTTNPADDQALIYAFAKAMDPESVVREGEYATVQKYAQSWAESFGFNAARIFSNTAFLTPQARENMKKTIRARFTAAQGQYENVRREYGRKIERITRVPGGVDELTDFGAAFPVGQQVRPDGASKTPTRGANPFRPQ